MHRVLLTGMLQFICYFIIKLLSINRRTTTTYPMSTSVSRICTTSHNYHTDTCL